ncbi:MAG: winged helix-turn-helix domain-containing protein [Polyangiaceae bacterium]
MAPEARHGRGADPERYVLVVGHESMLDAHDGAAFLLRQLGAQVRTLPLWGDVSDLAIEFGPPRVLVIEAGERPDHATLALRQAKKEAVLRGVPTLLAVPERQVARVEPSAGFDDFIVLPYFPAELYARIRALEWTRSEFFTEERIKVGNLVIDASAHATYADGVPVDLTAREFALLAFLATNRGKLLRRETLLAKVWGARYEGGARTVDIHVRRLRAKLGAALPLETLRGAGYRMAPPDDAPPDSRGVTSSRGRKSEGRRKVKRT